MPAGPGREAGGVTDGAATGGVSGGGWASRPRVPTGLVVPLASAVVAAAAAAAARDPMAVALRVLRSVRVRLRMVEVEMVRR